MERKTITIPPALLSAMETRDAQISTAIQRSLGRYLYLLADARRSMADLFSRGECGLILDACNGIAFFDAISIQWLHMAIADGIEIDHLDQKWEIDGYALIEKMTGLSTIQKFAIVDAAAVWWERTTREDSTPDIGELLAGHPDNDMREFLAV